MSKKNIAVASTMILLVLLVQFLGINRPFIGNFASYQTVMAEMARNFLRYDFTELLLPKLDWIIGSKQVLHMNQYPLSSLVAALPLKVFGGTLEFWGRFQSIVFNLSSAWLLGLIGSRFLGRRAGWIAFGLYLFSPLTIIYGQSFMSESVALFCLLASLWVLIAKDSLGSGRAFGAGLLFSLAIVNRIHFAAILPATTLCLVFSSRGNTKKGLWFLLSALLLPLLWYGYTYYATIRFDNLFTSMFLQIGVRAGTAGSQLLSVSYGLRLFEIVSGPLLTPLFFPFLFLGAYILSKDSRRFYMVLSHLLSACLVAVLIPQKVMAHDFYLYAAFPFLVLLAAKGVDAILPIFPKLLSAKWLFLILIFYFGVSARYFINPIFQASDSEKREVRVAQTIAKFLPSDAKVIIAAQNAPVFQYYLDRLTWHFPVSGLSEKSLGAYFLPNQFRKRLSPILESHRNAMRGGDPVKFLEFLRQNGATHFVVPYADDLDQNPVLLNYLKSHYRQISKERDNFYLFHLAPIS